MVEGIQQIMIQKQHINVWSKSPFPDEIQKEARQALIHLMNNNIDDLVDAYSIPLEFGTGGIRGKLGNGIGRMNVYTVGRAALGLSRYLAKKHEYPKICIAYDSRRMSKEFASLTAGIAASLNIQVFLFPSVAPTPLLSFAIRYHKAQGGVVITASHNPPEYNGFKAYLEDGGQLVSPEDELIIKEIESIEDWSQIPLPTEDDPSYKKYVKTINDDCFSEYLKMLKSSELLNDETSPIDKSSLKIVYTPLHGTGGKYLPYVLKKFGYENVILVPEEAEPDGNFPSARKPNPEEPKALERALLLSIQEKADLFLATDPDADRLGIGVRDPEGKYILLNGNQIGSIMAAYLCEKIKEKRKTSKSTNEIKFYLIKTIVTTDLQEAIAKENGIELKNVLTGFKYIAEEMTKIEKNPNEKFLFGGEESYGYLPVDFLRDKDSLSSALLIMEILAEKKNLLHYLSQIYLKYGLYLESLKSIDKEGSKGKQEIEQAIGRLREMDLIGRKIGKRVVEAVIDYKTHKIEGNYDLPYLSNLPSSNVIQIVLSGNGKLTIRPSGTEPKVKIYSSFQSLTKPANEDDLISFKKDLSKELTEVEKEFISLLNLETVHEQ
jgi:phosphoglucomutase/phosphomannomutase